MPSQDLENGVLSRSHRFFHGLDQQHLPSPDSLDYCFEIPECILNKTAILMGFDLLDTTIFNCLPCFFIYSISQFNLYSNANKSVSVKKRDRNVWGKSSGLSTLIR